MRIKTLLIFILLYSFVSIARIDRKFQFGNIQITRAEGRLVEIIDADTYPGGILASIRILPRTVEEMRIWIEHHGGKLMYAPAKYSRRWRLIEAGDKIYGFDYMFVPHPTDVEDIDLAAPVPFFPQVRVRDSYSEDCPYIYGLPVKIICLDGQLRFRKQWLLPIQVRGYFVQNGEIFVKGLYQGHLVHRFNRNQDDWMLRFFLLVHFWRN